MLAVQVTQEDETQVKLRNQKVQQMNYCFTDTQTEDKNYPYE